MYEEKLVENFCHRLSKVAASPQKKTLPVHAFYLTLDDQRQTAYALQTWQVKLLRKLTSILAQKKWVRDARHAHINMCMYVYVKYICTIPTRFQFASLING